MIFGALLFAIDLFVTVVTGIGILILGVIAVWKMIFPEFRKGEKI